MKLRPLAALPLVLLACDDAAPAGPPPLAFTPPRNPHLADSTWPIFHRDSYAQHSSPLPGITGAGQVRVDVVPTSGIPIFTLFEPAGDILVVVKSATGAALWKIDRETLTPVAHVDLAAGDTFAGAYGYVDAAGRAVVGVGTRLSRYTSDADSLDLEVSLDLTGALLPGEVLTAITVLYSGELAFVGGQGTVGIVGADLAGPPLAVEHLPDGEVSNGLTTDEAGGLYVVSARGLRRLDWTGGQLVSRWFEPLDAPFSTPRPGRLGIGSGTTPALVMDDAVVVADDAERMNLVVVRRAADTAGAPRRACSLPVFDEPSTTDNAIVVAGRTFIVEQNLDGGRGVARIDQEADGSCRRVWVADVHGPSCVPTLSLATNLVYVYTEEQGDWGLTGLDLSTGRTAFFAYAGSGGLYNNYYAAVTIGPDGRVYIGTIAGLVVFGDV